MKKIIFLLIAMAFILVSQPVKSQEKISGKQIYAEFGGPGVLFSANFDSRFKSGETLGFGYRLGLGFSFYEFEESTSTYDSGYSYYESYTHSYYTIPVGLNYVFGKKSSPHTFEVGAGATFLTRSVSIFYFDEAKKGNVIGNISFMYRRQPSDGGFTWRIGFTPIVGTSGDLFPSGAIGIGYAF
jgi:hypothetical protein